MSREIEFYKLTNKTLNKIAKQYGIKNLSQYYSHTDFNKNNPLYAKCLSTIHNDLNRAFAQYAFHVQNSKGERLSSIVKFIYNFKIINNICKDFDPKKFYETYNKYSDPIQSIVEEFYKKGIKWIRNKNKKKEVMYRYASRLWYGAQKFKKYPNLEDMENHYADMFNKKRNIEEFIEDFRNDVGMSIGVALACDFLKEFSTKFECIGKPDTHIIDAMNAFHKRDKELNNKYKYIDEMQEIVNEVNKKNNNITVYQLDRMIWLISTGDFFLDYSVSKQKFIDDICKIR